MATINNTTFSWFFETFYAYPTMDNYKDVVFMVRWTYKGTYVDSNGVVYKSERPGTSQISTNDIKTFIPFEQLTQNDVIEWVSQEENITTLQQQLVDSINNQITPPPPTIIILSAPFEQNTLNQN